MTNYYFGCNNVQGIVDESPTIATSSQSKDLEVNINGTNVTDKQTALLLLEKMAHLIATGNGNNTANGGWPPM